MGRYSKAKGADWERTVCKRLSLWVSNLTREDIFWRSAMSGGRATFATRSGRLHTDGVAAQAGDISAISAEGEPLLNTFFVECKSYADLKLLNCLYDHKGTYDIIWDTPLREAKKYGKQVLVIAKENGRDPVVLTTKESYKLLKKFVKPGHDLPLKAILVKRGIHIFSFRDLLGSVSYEDFAKSKRATKNEPA